MVVSRLALACAVVVVAMGAIVLFAPPAAHELVYRPLFFVAMIASSWFHDRHRGAIEEWSETPPWVRHLFVASAVLFALWWMAALTAAIRFENDKLVPWWALAARYLTFTGLAVAILDHVVRWVRGRLAAR